MRRRNLLGGAVWLLWIPTAVYAQRADARRRVGMLIALSSDPEEQRYVAALLEGLRRLGWTPETAPENSAGPSRAC
jgi:hypothetical protein